MIARGPFGGGRVGGLVNVRLAAALGRRFDLYLIALMFCGAVLLPAARASAQPIDEPPPLPPPVQPEAAPDEDEDGEPEQGADPDEADAPPEPELGDIDAEPQPINEPAYTVRGFQLRYGVAHPEQPLVIELEQIPLTLTVAEGGLVGPGLPGPKMRTSVLELGAETRVYGVSAINAISEAFVRELNRRGIIGVFVSPSPDELDLLTGDDLRPPGEEDLTLLVRTGVVTELRTIASGSRVRPEARINNPKHRRIARGSPLQPASGDRADGDLLRKERLDNYVFRLNRHPGRRVDVAIASAGGGDGVVLDYLIRENRPLSLYAQISNTGTEQTSEIRERFGLSQTQLLGIDDIFTFDFVTANFEDTNAYVASYSLPLERQNRWWLRAFGSYSEFEASDVGAADESFSGENFSGGGEVSALVFQDEDLFIDAFAGARFESVEVNNDTVMVSGSEDLFLPKVGVRASQRRDTYDLNAELAYEWTMNSVTGATAEGFQELGRLGPDRDWEVLKGEASFSFFLEPLLYPNSFDDPGTPGTSTLAHEVLLRTRGQFAFDNRLVPTEQAVIGGLYSVRGYPESIIAGDSFITATAEYRFHLPRSFAIQPEPGTLFGRPFRRAPQQVFGRPDWDLIFRAFVDAGYVVSSKAEAFESNETLIGAGVGVELSVRRNLQLRVDWATVLNELPDTSDAEAGDNRLHFIATILY